MPKNSPWTNYTKELLKVSDLSQARLAEKLSKRMNIDASQGYVAGKLNSADTLPPDDLELEHWSDSMELSGEMRRKFFRLAQIERIPKRYRTEYTELFEKYEKTRKTLENVQKQNLELKDLISSLQTHVADLTAQTAKLIAKGERLGSE